MDILDFDGAHHIGKPEGWSDELDGYCASLPIAVAIDPQSGVPFMYSFYRPTPEEMEELRAGGAIRLGISGRTHPVINFGFVPKTTMDEVNARVHDHL